MVCKFNLVFKQKTEAKKVDIFGGTPIFAPKKKFNPPPPPQKNFLGGGG